MRGNRESLTERVAARVGVSCAEAQRMVDAVLGSAIEELVEKGSFLVTGLGSMKVVAMPERMARNPQNGEKVTVPKRRVVKFTPGASLTRYVNGEPFPEGRSVLAKRPKGSLK